MVVEEETSTYKEEVNSVVVNISEAEVVVGRSVQVEVEVEVEEMSRSVVGEVRVVVEMVVEGKEVEAAEVKRMGDIRICCNSRDENRTSCIASAISGPVSPSNSFFDR